MKKVYSALLLSWMLMCFHLNAQQLAPAIVWQKSLGGSNDDRANAIIRTPDGGFLTVGYSKSNDGDVSGHHGTSTTTDAWVVKLSSSGNIEWQKSLGGTGNDAFTSAIIATDGSYICMGKTSSNDGDVNGNHGQGDIWIVKLSRYGSLTWSKCFGGTKDEIAGNIRSINNKYYFIGSTFPTMVM